MSDIYGRSVSREQPGVTIAAVKKIIRDGIEKLTKRIRDIVRTEIAETLNIAEVDPGEIVVFENANGKLKTSNMHLSDILTRQRNVAEDTMALYSGDGSLKPGTLVSTITDKLTAHDKELDDHIKNYNGLRRNVINKFFGLPIVLSLSLAEIKTSIDEIAEIKKSVSDLNLEELQKSVNDVKTAIESINANLPKLEKVKIPHPVANILNIVYVTSNGTLDWIKDTQIHTPMQTIHDGDKGILYLNDPIYRFIIVSDKIFNVQCVDQATSKTIARGVNTVMFTTRVRYLRFFMEAVDSDVIRSKILWSLEFVTVA